MKTVYFDCFHGAAGDMIVASLVDAGADVADLRAGLEKLRLDGYALSIEQVQKQGFAATRFHVELDQNRVQPHRHLGDIQEIIDKSDLPRRVAQRAGAVFERLAQAEAAVHGTSIDRVHFHEVGAVDAILDIVGAALSLELLGVDQVVCSPIPTGWGTVVCAHGTLPIPAPATAQLLKGVPIYSGDTGPECKAGSTGEMGLEGEAGEWTTPTGAAVLTTLAERFGALPSMTVASVGYGAGQREGAGRPNLLRVFLGKTPGPGDTDEVTVLETNLDDATPQMLGHCMERLLAEGALDAYAVPIHMKKSRSGVVLTVLCQPDHVDGMERILFAETTTFGIRRHHAVRAVMHRRHERVETPFGPITIKVGERDGVVTATPEYEDCRKAAQQHSVALRDVLTAAQMAWQANRAE